jgi:hypothetical protein
VLRTKYEGSDALFRVGSLGELREGHGLAREEVCAVSDGNVALARVPQAVQEFDAYVSILASSLRQLLGSASVVVVVFDDSAQMTEAKRAEQAKRDAGRAKSRVVASSDVDAVPRDDDYGETDILQLRDCHALMSFRPARNRFFDAVCVAVLNRLRPQMERWEEQGFPTCLLFDGIDPRGANRPLGTQRRPQLWGSCAESASALQHAEAGEGDLKLLLVEQCVSAAAAAATARFGAMRAVFNVTIDTDSISLGLIEAARRECAGESGVLSLLALQDSDGFLVVDSEKLYAKLQAEIWGRLEATAEERRRAMLLLIGGWALGGCDFTGVPGFTAEMAFDVVPALARTMRDELNVMDDARGERSQVGNTSGMLRKVVFLGASSYAERPRSKRSVIEKLHAVESAPLLRASWCLSYWSLNEIKGDLTEFGF